jgi:hypothetical protein
MITLAVMLESSKQYIKAEGLFRHALEMLENVRFFYQSH